MHHVFTLSLVVYLCTPYIFLMCSRIVAGRYKESGFLITFVKRNMMHVFTAVLCCFSRDYVCPLPALTTTSGIAITTGEASCFQTCNQIISPSNSSSKVILVIFCIVLFSSSLSPSLIFPFCHHPHLNHQIIFISVSKCVYH